MFKRQLSREPSKLTLPSEKEILPKWRITEAQTVLLQYLPPASRLLLPHHQEGPSACFFFTWWPSGSVKLEFSIYTRRWAHLFRSCVCVGGVAVSQSSQELPWVGGLLLPRPLCTCNRRRYPGLSVGSAGWMFPPCSAASQLPAGPACLCPEGRWGSGSVCSGCHNKMP